MATVGKLMAELALETASFHRDMGKAVSTLNSSAAQMNKALGSLEKGAKLVFGAFAGLGAAISVSAFKDQIVKSLEAADALGDMAKSVNLSTDAYQELAYAQMLNSGSQESLNAGMLKFNQIIGDAANGSKSAVDALQRVGITTDELKSKSIDQLFVEASDGLNKMGESASRNSAMIDVFGKESAKSAEAFSLSAKELAAFRAEAQASGAVLGADIIQNAQVTKDKFDALSKIIGNQLTQAFIAFAPLLIKMAQGLTSVAKAAVEVARSFGLIAQDKSAETQIAATTERINALAKRSIELRAQIEGGASGPALANAKIELAAVQQSIEDASKRLNALKESAKTTPQGVAAKPAVTDIKPVKPPEDPTKSQYIVDLAEKRAALAESLKSEQVLEEQSYQYKMRLLEEVKRTEIGDKAENLAMMEQLELEHQAKLGNIWAQGALERKKFDAMTWNQQAKTVFGTLAQITAGTAQENRKMFELNKAAAIGSAIINTAEGATKALAQGGIWGVALAAVVVAAGLAQINAIKNQQFGGGGSAPSVTGTTPATPVSPVGGSMGSSGGGQTTIIQLEGEVFSRDAVRNLLEKLGEEQADGGRLLVA